MQRQYMSSMFVFNLSEAEFPTHSTKSNLNHSPFCHLHLNHMNTRVKILLYKDKKYQQQQSLRLIDGIACSKSIAILPLSEVVFGEMVFYRYRYSIGSHKCIKIYKNI